MRAYGHTRPTSLDEDDALVEIDAPEPKVGPDDLLVAVKAVSVNPIDFKARKGVGFQEGPRVLGWDAAGEVIGMGANVTGFAKGDAVWYAGDLTRPGSDAERQAVDHRIVSKKPERLSFAEAAAMPLTTITAWEMLFDRLAVGDGAGRSILIVGAGGGVGSIAIQLARRLTGLTVIATASRPETTEWVESLGAHHVVNHAEPFAEAVKRIVPDGVDYAFGINRSGEHLPQIAEAMRPQGRFGLIDDPEGLDVSVLKTKSISLHWELMFTRPIFRTPDMGEQGRLLGRVASMVDAGEIRTTLDANLGRLSVETLRDAHARLESGRAKGKMVLEL